jgi:hypothetical protein
MLRGTQRITVLDKKAFIGRETPPYIGWRENVLEGFQLVLGP